ncbi:PACE efflux transporter [Colwellia sp. 4_MG-2023]|uniref:PACE efflux transporter n=1 Tax=unclassified Colwellia TaxID=196834 RepID=UPI001915E2BF|nr:MULTISPECIES: PACE efflux transporter [unclassified Colwellia]MDO6487028.1 PACE efflux transporter [Colwellia sp. 6_MG-2023]MDO6507707.1 PACE efflux transporter [Colwellia sp. 5_MG-2023]MDO6556309.1 PACE efflux transporter [Colwellia sp. 4_MG-2023]
MNVQSISTTERILHSVLFEAIALIFMIYAAMNFIDVDTKSATGLAMGLSLIAMFWNYFYNLVFDHIFGDDRINRTIKMRIGHGLGFELGLTFVTLPLIMWVLQLDFWIVAAMETTLILFFLLYAIIYNWCYDLARVRIISAL